MNPIRFTNSPFLLFTRITLAAASVLLGVGGAAAQSTYVYVGNYSDNTVSGYSSNPQTGILTPVPGSPFVTGVSNPGFVSLDQNCIFAYVPGIISNNVAAFATDTNTGRLIQIPGSPIAVGTEPLYSTIDRLGKFLYVPNLSDNTLSGFSIDRDSGMLTGIPGSPFAAGAGPLAANIDPSDRFLYVTNDTDGHVSGFGIDPNTGVLTSIPGSPWAVGGHPRWVTADRTGKFLYVTSTASGNITVFRLDQNNGSLTQSGPPIFIGSDLYRLVIDPTNQFAYVGQNGVGVYGFSIDSTSGFLTPLSGFPIRTESPQGNPTLTWDPLNRFLYVANQATNTVGVWYSDTASGALTQIPGSPFSTGAFPSAITACSTYPDASEGTGQFPQLSGGNTFTGNQTVNGNVSASAFTGNGAGLTGVAAATANTANFANTANNATFAATANFANAATIATSAGIATNSLSLGGTPAGNYARLDIGNNLAGNQIVTGNIGASGNLSAGGLTTIGSGTPILRHLSRTFNLSVSPLSPASCAPLQTLALTGASDGDSLALGIPDSLLNPSHTGAGILNYSAWVSAANTVLIRVCNVNPSAPKARAVSGIIRVDVWKH